MYRKMIILKGYKATCYMKNKRKNLEKVIIFIRKWLDHLSA